MAKPHDVVIVGGGAVGSAFARELAATGRSVLVIDAGDRPGEAWRASAGMLDPQSAGGTDDPLFDLGIGGRQYYHDRRTELLEETGVDIGLHEGGILRLARGALDEQRLRNAVGWQRQHGHRTEWLDPGEVASEHPWVGRNDGALFAPHDGAVDPIKLVEALRKSAAIKGATILSDLITEIVIESDRVTAVRGNRGSYPGGEIVLAAGAWTGRIAGLPRPVSVEPVRGQMFAKPWPDEVPKFIVVGPEGYVVPRDGEALCGATSEHAGFMVHQTEGGMAQIASWTNSLIPKLESSPITRKWVGLRPGTPDGLPIFGPEPSVGGLWYATGYGRHGILLAGITAIALCHLMAKESTYESVEALRPERFWAR